MHSQSWAGTRLASASIGTSRNVGRMEDQKDIIAGASCTPTGRERLPLPIVFRTSPGIVREGVPVESGRHVRGPEGPIAVHDALHQLTGAGQVV